MSDFLTGVTINVNGTPATITAATRQADHAVVHYAITPAVEAGDTVTFEYAAASGHIVSESGGEPLGDVVDAEVTNNVAGGGPTLPDVSGSTALLALLASDFSGLTDDVGIGTAWNDHSAIGNNFALGAGSLQPTKTTVGGKTRVQFDYGQWMQGPNFADSLSMFAVFIVADWPNHDTTPPNTNAVWPMITKISNQGDGAGWMIDGSQTGGNIRPDSFFQDAGGNHFDGQPYFDPILTTAVYVMERDGTNINIYIDGVLTTVKEITFTDYSNSEPVRINVTGDITNDGYTVFTVGAFLIYQITNLNVWQSTDRAAITAWLAANT